MNRRLGLWVSAVGALLATALIAAPVWDLWRYRRLRAPIGPHVAVGVILPLRTVQATAPAPTAGTAGMPATTAAPSASTGPAVTAVPASVPRSASRVATASAVPAVLPASGARSPAASGVASALARRTYPAPQPIPAAGPQPRPAAAGDKGSADPAPGEEETARDTTTDATDEVAPTVDAASPGSGVAIPVVAWPAPGEDRGPQLPPEPQPGPPTPHPPAPQPRIRDPRRAPEVIPMLTLVAPAVPVAVGDSFTVMVRLSGGSDITSLPFHVEFDPAILQFQFAQRGPVVDSTMPAILLASVNPERPGDLAVGLSLVESSRLLQGSGTVLRLQFLALAPGHSPLGFSRASVRGSMSETLDAQFHGAGIDVR